MKTNTAAPAAQIADNPQVLIKYNPEQALVLLGHQSQATLGKLQGIKITSVKTLEAASDVLEEATERSGQLETFRTSLVDSVQKAALRFREIPGFEDFEVTLTIKRWGLRSLIANGIENIRRARASFLAAEQKKQRQAQLEAEAKQREANEKAAKEAAAAAKRAGADKVAQEAIKQDVLATPAPILASKVLDTAKAAGATVRYNYKASLQDAESFLRFCLSNEVMLKTVCSDLGIAAAIEKALTPMAKAQREHFNFPGMVFLKEPVDVNRRSF